MERGQKLLQVRALHHWIERASINRLILIASGASFLVCSIARAVYIYIYIYIIESVDSINRDERGFPLTQYITNGGITSARNTSTHFKHHHRVLRLISNRISV